MSLWPRFRARRREREQTHAALVDFAAAFTAGRRVLLDGKPDEQPYDAIVSLGPTTTARLAPNGFLITAEVPTGFASIHRFGDAIFVATNDPKWRDLQLHLGSGPVALPGWVNVDNLPYPGVDFQWDLARGIPFHDVKYIFAEHFVEHLSFDEAGKLVRGCRAALRDDGILRLSTPNLDWVWRTSYQSGDALRDCFVINRAFHGWGHQFLYNLPALTMVLRDAGFATVQQFTYGQSDSPALAGIERHERYPDIPELPHILIVEASGRAQPAGERHPMVDEYRRDVAVR